MKIKLNDGAVIECEREGGLLVCGGDVTRETFAGRLAGASVIDDAGNAELSGVLTVKAFERQGDKSYVWLAEVPEMELAVLKNAADIEYAAMMMGVEL